MTSKEFFRVLRALGQVSIDQERAIAANQALERSLAAAREACRDVGLDPNDAPFQFDDEHFTITPMPRPPITLPPVVPPPPRKRK